MEEKLVRESSAATRNRNGLFEKRVLIFRQKNEKIVDNCKIKIFVEVDTIIYFLQQFSEKQFMNVKHSIIEKLAKNKNKDKE